MNGFVFEVKWSDSNSNGVKLEVVDFQGTEAISQNYEFKINLRSTQLVKNVTSVVGLNANLIIGMDAMHGISSSVQKSNYHGIITEFALFNKIKDYYYYQATLCPKLAKLKYTTQSDVFINQGLGDIISNVFNKNQLSQEDYQLKFNVHDKKYKPSNECDNRYAFVCQYQESDFSFANRLLERDGVFYFFQQQENGMEKLIVVDNNSDCLTRSRSLNFRFLSEQTAAPDPNAIHFFNQQHKLAPQKITLLNYNYEKANLGDNGVISCSAYVGKNGHEDKNFFGEEVIYGENFISAENGGDGQFLASIRAEELYCYSQFYTAKSTAVPINAGMRIKIDDNRNDEFNGEYLVVAITHNGEQLLNGVNQVGKDMLFYENTLTLLPVDIPFRPRRVTPAPSINGTLNALIDGEQNSSSPQIDDNGRYKVRFPFLTTAKPDGKGSAWVRMATPYVGNNYGFNFPLVKGVEVVLSFRNGNPDLPMIIGAVFNSVNKNIVNNDNSFQGGVIITRSSNTLVMNDQDSTLSVGIKTKNGNWHYYK